MYICLFKYTILLPVQMSSSPMPPMTPLLDQRRTTLSHSHATMPGMRTSASPTFQHSQAHQPLLVQAKIVNNPGQMGSMPFLPTTMPHQLPMHMQPTANTLGHLNVAWNRPRGSLQGFPQVPQVVRLFHHLKSLNDFNFITTISVNIPAGTMGKPRDHSFTWDGTTAMGSPDATRRLNTRTRWWCRCLRRLR